MDLHVHNLPSGYPNATGMTACPRSWPRLSWICKGGWVVWMNDENGMDERGKRRPTTEEHCIHPTDRTRPRRLSLFLYLDQHVLGEAPGCNHLHGLGKGSPRDVLHAAWGRVGVG